MRIIAALLDYKAKCLWEDCSLFPYCPSSGFYLTVSKLHSKNMENIENIFKKQLCLFLENTTVVKSPFYCCSSREQCSSHRLCFTLR